MTQKLFEVNDGGVGVRLDPNFLSHQASCRSCQRYYEQKPATTTLMCLEGSVLWKRENVQDTGRVMKARSATETSKAEAKRLMKYK